MTKNVPIVEAEVRPFKIAMWNWTKTDKKGNERAWQSIAIQKSQFKGTENGVPKFENQNIYIRPEETLALLELLERFKEEKRKYEQGN